MGAVCRLMVVCIKGCLCWYIMRTDNEWLICFWEDDLITKNTFITYTTSSIPTKPQTTIPPQVSQVHTFVNKHLWDEALKLCRLIDVRGVVLENSIFYLIISFEHNSASLSPFKVAH